MIRVHCDGRSVDLAEGETVLDALLRGGVPVAHSCRAGACQSCLARAIDGAPPLVAQAGLRRQLAEQGYFLACQALPERDLSITFAGIPQRVGSAVIAARELLAADVVRLSLAPDEPFSYRAGQFVVIARPGDGLARSYSLASVPGVDARLELHVRVLADGQMSRWLSAPDAPGQRVALRGPSGECFYSPGRPDQPLVLAGAGTGLAPLVGILRDALHRGHHGPITLLHGGRTLEGLYLVDELRALAAGHSNFTYLPCSLAGNPTEGVAVGELPVLLTRRHPSLADHGVFLCGDPAIVFALRKTAFLSGAHLADIHADAFVPARPAPGARDDRGENARAAE